MNETQVMQFTGGNAFERQDWYFATMCNLKTIIYAARRQSHLKHSICWPSPAILFFNILKIAFFRARSQIEDPQSAAYNSGF